MKRLKQTLGAWIILCPFFIHGQLLDDTGQSQISVGAGIGVSAFPGFFTIIENLDESDSFTTTNGPAYTGYIDWNPNKHFSLGINGGFQKLQQNITGFSFDVGDSLYTVDKFNYSLNRTNIGICAKIYYDNNNKVDIYSGVKMGLSIFKINVDVNDDLLVNELEKNLRFPLSTPSFQLIIMGIKYYPTQYLGFFGEVGIGAPAIVQAGISVRIPYTK